MPVAPRALPPELGDVFAYPDALDAGASARRMRALDLEAPHRGVRRRVIGHPESPASDTAPLALDRATQVQVWRDARSYAVIMPRQAFFAGRTAAILRGVPVAPAPTLDVAVFAPARAPRVRGVRARTLSPGYATVQTVDGLRVASPASTWAMLGTELSERELVRLGDAIVRVPRDEHGRPRPERRLATLDDLRAALDVGRRPGAVRLRAALARIRVGAMSPLETDMRLDAVDAGLPEPELDAEVRSVQGRLLGIADGRYRAYRVLIEVEGDHHRTDRRQWARDIEKHAAYAAAGYETVRLTGIQIRHHPEQGVALIRSALMRGGWVPDRR
jgi:hypothetical protein